MGVVKSTVCIRAPIPWTSSGSEQITVPAPSQTTTAASIVRFRSACISISDAPKGMAEVPLRSTLRGVQKP